MDFGWCPKGSRCNYDSEHYLPEKGFFREVRLIKDRFQMAFIKD